MKKILSTMSHLKFFSLIFVSVAFLIGPAISFASDIPSGAFSTATIDNNSLIGAPLAASDNFGRSATSIGDLNGDGYPDIAVGAPLDDTGGVNRGAVYIHFLSTFGNIQSTVKIDSATPGMPTLHTGDEFGFSVTSIADLDHNGTRELLIGAPFDDSNGTNAGAAYVLFLNSDGSIIRSVKINNDLSNGPTSSAGDEFGYSVAEVGDYDGNGISDIAIGAPFSDGAGTNAGKIYIHHIDWNGSLIINSTDSVYGASLAANDNYGSSIANVGDVDANGYPDIAVGSPMDDTNGTNRGAIYIHYFSGTSIINTVKIDDATVNGPALSNGDQFGSSLAGIGDYNLDSIPDIAVGSPMNDTGGSNRGAVEIMTLNSDGSIIATTQLDSNTPNGATLADGDQYGLGLASADLNNDGMKDLVVGAPLGDIGAINSGAIHIHFLATPVIVMQTGSYGRVTNISESGGNDTFDVRLASQPADTVTLDFSASSSELALAGDTIYNNILTFTPENWNEFQTVAVSASDDGGLVNGNHIDTISYVATSTDATYNNFSGGFSVNVTDDDNGPIISQSDNTTSVTEGGPTDSFTMVLPAAPTHDVVINLNSQPSQPGGDQATISTNQLTFTPNNWNTPQEVTVQAIDDTEVENYTTNQQVAYSLTGDRLYEGLSFGKGQSVLIHVVDNDISAVNITQSDASVDIAESGTTDTFNVALNSEPIDDVTVSLTTSGRSALDKSILTFTPSNWHDPQEVTVSIEDDKIFEGARSESIDYIVTSGDPGFDGITVPGAITINIASDTPNLYWVGGSGTWDTSATHWATACDGTNTGSIAPDQNYNVIFDSSCSGNSSSDEILINTGSSTALNVDFGKFTGTISNAATLFVYGSLTLGSGMTNLYTGPIQFFATDARTITSNGVTLHSSLVFNGAGATWTLQDDLNNTDSIHVVNGAFDANNHNVTTQSVTVDQSAAAMLDMGSGMWTITGTSGTVWDFPGSEATLNAGTSNIKLVGMNDGSITFSGGSHVYHDFSLTGSVLNGGALTILGSNTFNDFIDDTAVAHTIYFENSSTQSLNLFNLHGSANNMITLASNSSGTQWNLSVAGGGISTDYVILQDSNATGGATFGAGSHSTNVSNNTGWVFKGATNASSLMLPDQTNIIDYFTSNGPTLADNDNFGRSVTTIGDIDGDGIEDIAVGAPLDDTGGTNRGAVYVHLMNSDGSIKSTVKLTGANLTDGFILQPGDEFGFSLTSILDQNGDGRRELAVGAPLDDTGGTNRGAVYVLFLNANGSISSTVKFDSTTTNGPTLHNGDEYGYSVAEAGDYFSGSPLLAVGAPFDDTGGTNRGAVHLSQLGWYGFLTIGSTFNITSGSVSGPTLLNNDNYGASVANIGDIDGNGYPDIAVGAPFDDTGGTNRGAVYVHLMSYETVASTTKIDSTTTNGPTLTDGDQYGSSVAGIGYLNSDSIPDLAVGVPFSDVGGINRGAISLHALNSDGSIIATTQINGSTSNGPTLADNDEYGFAIANSNLDGDKIIYAGSLLNDTGGPNRGAVYVHRFSKNISFIPSKKTLEVSEAGETDTFDVSLNAQPTGSVTLYFSNDNGGVTFSGNTMGGSNDITFTPNNWDTPQTVTVHAIDDGIVQGTHTDTIKYTSTSSSDSRFMNLSGSIVSVNITDNDNSPIITESDGSTDVMMGGSTDSFTVVLPGAPEGDAVITFTPTHGSELVTLSPSSLTFNNTTDSFESWNVPQTVTVHAVNDQLLSDEVLHETLNYQGSGDPVYDNVSANGVITVNISHGDLSYGIKGAFDPQGPTRSTEGGSSLSGFISLNAQPADDVTITFQNEDGQLEVPKNVVFTHDNWNISQSITFNAVDDQLVEGDHSGVMLYSMVSNDQNFNGITNHFEIPITDNDMGNGSEEHPYQITSCASFEAISNNLSAYYELNQNLDCSSEGRNIVIGDGGQNAFSGHFDGKGHTITVAIDMSDSNYVGLFRTLNGAKITNLRIAGTSSGNGEVGGLTGAASNSLIQYVVSSVAITDVGSNGRDGGLVGQLTAGSSIKNSYATGNVSSSGGQSLGGLVGFMDSNASITNSYAIGSVVNGSNIGGLVGEADSANAGTITGSFASGYVNGGNYGGFIGILGSVVLINDHFDATLSGVGATCAVGYPNACNAENQENNTPGYFKNNSTSAPLDSWNFSTVWQTTSEYPELLSNPSEVSSDATLTTASTIKGETVSTLGTPNASLGSLVPGNVTLTEVQGTDTSNSGAYITAFARNDAGATIEKVVKYSSGADTNFAFDAAYNGTDAVSDGDFFIIKVVAGDSHTVLYYQINVTVIPTPGAHITAQTPENDSVGVPVGVSPTLQFSVPMFAVSLNSSTVQLRKYDDNSVVAASILYNSEAHTVTIDPSSDLEYSTHYYIWSNGTQSGVGDTITNYSATAKDIHDFVTAPLETGSLAVTGVDAVQTVATADNTFAHGFSWTMHVTAPVNESLFQLKLADLTSGLNTIAAANNIRYCSEQSNHDCSSDGAWQTLTAANTYGPAITLSGDLAPTTAGRQVDIKIQVKVPVSTPGGSYSSSYGVQTNLP